MRTLASIFKVSLLIPLLTAATVAAQTQLVAPEPTPTHIQAELTTPVKLPKAKVGDKLKAVTVTQVNVPNGPSIPAGSTVMGQVQKVDGASVTVTFDQVNVDGKKIPLNITLVAAALMGGPKTRMSEGSGSSKMDSPSGGSLPNDHPLNGGGYSVTEAGSNAASGVSHESLSEINSGATVKRGAEVRTTAGSVIGLPGVALAIDEGAPFASKFELKNKEQQLPKGLQLMFSVR
ncbi:MAG: hypothetical protein WBW33_26810 [Bryobacteraceae bacterium]